MLHHVMVQKRVDFEGLKLRCRADALGRHLIVLLKSLQFLMIRAMWYHYGWVNTYQMNISGKFKYSSKTAECAVHGSLLHYMFYLVTICCLIKSFTCNRKRQSTVNKYCPSGQCSTASHGSKFSCLVFVSIEKQRFGDDNFSGGKKILIINFFCC